MPNSGFSNVPDLIFAGTDSPYSNRLDAAGRVSNGTIQVTKKLVFVVPDGVSPRAYNGLDVFYHPLFPQKGAALDEDPRLTFTGDAEITHWMDDGKCIEAELTYSSPDFSVSGNPGDGDPATDKEGNKITPDTPPWKLRPQGVRISSVTQDMTWKMAYDYKGGLVDRHGNATNPCVNAAGDMLKVQGPYRAIQLSFTFYKQANSWSIARGREAENSINLDNVIVCGELIAAGTGLIKQLNQEYITTYKNNGKSVKWRYWKLDVTILVDPARRMLCKNPLNIGDRAYHPELATLPDIDDVYFCVRRDHRIEAEADLVIPATQYPQQIVTFHPLKILYYDSAKGQTILGPNLDYTIWCGWKQFIAYREFIRQYSEEYQYQIPDIQCEQMHDIPLTVDGLVDFQAMTTRNYSTKTFWLHPQKNWAFVSLPRNR